MNFEAFTERVRGFIQAAHDLAQGRSHQKLTSEHLLKVLLDDEEGLCANLIRSSGGDPSAANKAVDTALDKQPRVEGDGASTVYIDSEASKILKAAQDIAKNAGDEFVTVERLLLALVMAADRGKRLRSLKELHPRSDRSGTRGPARSGYRPRGGNPPHGAGAVAAHQEQPGSHRRAGCR